MSDEKRYTEREKVEAERSAFADAVSWCRGATDLWSDSWITRRDHLYPLPKVTRPRVAADPHGVGEWRATNAFSYPTVEQRHGPRRDWRVTDWSLLVTEARIKVWADLLANPTEEVDAE